MLEWGSVEWKRAVNRAVDASNAIAHASFEDGGQARLAGLAAAARAELGVTPDDVLWAAGRGPERIPSPSPSEVSSGRRLAWWMRWYPQMLV